MSAPVELVLMWHMHQPEYRDYATREFRRPWVLLHAIKDYTDMAAHLERYPKMRAVVNFSPVLIDGEECGWFGLGPVAVEPERQRERIGTALIEHGLAHLRARGARGCVVLGDPAYYRRFGFEPDRTLAYPAAPAEYF